VGDMSLTALGICPLTSGDSLRILKIAEHKKLSYVCLIH
jgi:hypothetical protein